MLWIIVAALLGVGAALPATQHDERKSYKGYQVLDVVPQTQEQLTYFRNLMLSDTEFIDFWAEPSTVGKTVSMMLSPMQRNKVEVWLRKHGVKYETSIKDVESILTPMWKQLDSRKQAKGGQVFDIEDFNTVEDINAWLETTAAACPAAINCEVYSVGNSAEGRPINVIRIYQAGANRRAYWIDSAIHAREWIAPATTLKVIDNLARRADTAAVRLTDAYDWYILPVMNPDGYSYTWTSDRLWRKNRRANEGSQCFGTDLNRNFDFRWGTEGVSHMPCSDTYCGPVGGSEPETQAVQAELVRLGPSLLATVTVHSYGQMWMFPWGNTVNHNGVTCDRADDHDDMMIVADAAANAIEDTYNSEWARGNSCEVIYETTGGTDDYAKGVAGVKYAFCPELRGNNFVISADNITPSFNEFWNGVIAMADSING